MAYLQHKIYRYTACCQTFVLFHWTQKKIGRTSKRCQSTGLYWRTLESQSKCSNAELCCILYCTCNLLAVSCVMEKNPSVHLSVWPFFFCLFFLSSYLFVVVVVVFLLLSFWFWTCICYSYLQEFMYKMYVFTCMNVCMFNVCYACMYVSVCLSVYRSVHLSFFLIYCTCICYSYLQVFMYLCIYLCMYVCMYVCLSLSLSLCLSMYLSFRPSYASSSLWKHMENHKVKQDSKAFQLVRCVLYVPELDTNTLFSLQILHFLFILIVLVNWWVLCIQSCEVYMIKIIWGGHGFESCWSLYL